MTKSLATFGLLALAMSGCVQAQGGAPAGLKEYTCWSLLTEPEEYHGAAEIFYLGYALGQAGTELKDEAAYEQVVAEVVDRCKGEPDTKVLDAFDAAIKSR